MSKTTEVLNLENVRIGFRNFEGKEGPYNDEGKRSFAVFLDSHNEAEAVRNGWNVKYPKDREQTDEPDTREPYLPVAIDRNSKVVAIINDVPTVLEEGAYSMLDYAEIVATDLVLRPYNWSVLGKDGVKAYLKAAYITIETDAFSRKYGI